MHASPYHQPKESINSFKRKWNTYARTQKKKKQQIESAERNILFAKWRWLRRKLFERWYESKCKFGVRCGSRRHHTLIDDFDLWSNIHNWQCGSWQCENHIIKNSLLIVMEHFPIRSSDSKNRIFLFCRFSFSNVFERLQLIVGHPW